MRWADEDDYPRVVDYFHGASDAYLLGMQVDRARLPARDEWLARLLADHRRADREKETCFTVWELDGARAGHSNINRLTFGEEAFIHLHFWQAASRRRGAGTSLFRRTAEMMVKRFQLRRLLCEPWAHNPAPNALLPKAGFRFVRSYWTTPGPINREQEVNRWEYLPGQ